MKPFSVSLSTPLILHPFGTALYSTVAVDTNSVRNKNGEGRWVWVWSDEETGELLYVGCTKNLGTAFIIPNAHYPNAAKVKAERIAITIIGFYKSIKEAELVTKFIKYELRPLYGKKL